MVYSVLGISAGQFALLLIAAAIRAFVVTGKLERKVNPESPVKSFPVTYHRLAAVVLLIVGLALAAAPDRKTRFLPRPGMPATCANTRRR